jgi:universal stress protein E
MQVFQNILVGIDPDTLEHGSFGEQAIRTALWLAQKTSAAVVFFATYSGQLPSSAEAVLADFQKQAEANHIRSSIQFSKGSAATEIVRQVQRGNHDLVLIGMPRKNGWFSTLFGSTTTTLLSECPCPVWLARSGSLPIVRNLVVASNLTATSMSALRLGVNLSLALHIPTHLLTVVEYPLDHHWSTGDRDLLTVRYHQEIRTQAEEFLASQVEQLGHRGEPLDIRLHAVGRTEIPDVEILHFVRAQQIDLLVLGRSLHPGLEDTLLGDTGERLLPEISCSVLVVKGAN